MLIPCPASHFLSSIPIHPIFIPSRQDMDLMFDNAIKFNPKEHIIHELVSMGGTWVPHNNETTHPCGGSPWRGGVLLNVYVIKTYPSGAMTQQQ